METFRDILLPLWIQWKLQSAGQKQFFTNIRRFIIYLSIYFEGDVATGDSGDGEEDLWTTWGGSSS